MCKISPHSCLISDELRVTKAALYRLKSQPHTQQDEDFAAVMEWAVENRDVCSVIASHPEPVIMLATDKQLRIWNASLVGSLVINTKACMAYLLPFG